MKKAALLLVCGLLLFSGISAGHSEKKPDLTQKYKDWLDLTEYICLPQEREVFFKLANDRERDSFIESFWKQRDPTPGTPQNEYREEILRRFLYVNQEFGRGTARQGWRTDMGKFYMILGPPTTRERYEEERGLYPCEAWYYHGDPERGLPTYFGLLFFKKGGGGEFRLYNPISDGPASLLVEGQNYDPASYAVAYARIKDVAPTLAPLTLSMIPGETPPDFQPSMRTEIILADIINSPRREVSPSYATHFLNYRGIVSTEYLTNYVDIDGEAIALPDSRQGINFVHFTLWPKRVSVDYYRPKDQYFCNYSVDVSLRDGEKIIFQYAKEFPFYYSPADDPIVRASGIALEDSFPMIEGVHELAVLVRNSVSKEFSVYNKQIRIDKSAAPKIAGFLLGYKLGPAPPSLHSPFQVADKRLSIDPKNTFAREDDIIIAFTLIGVTRELWQSGEARLLVKGLEGTSPQEKSFELPLNAYGFQEIMPVIYSIPAADWGPNYYEILLDIVSGDGRVVDEQKVHFVVSPTKLVARPVTIAKTFPLASGYLYAFMIADQYDKAGMNPEAAVFFDRAYAAAPEYREGAVYYANFLLKTGNPARALEVVEKLKGEDKFRFDYYLIKGKAHMSLGAYPEAIACFLEGNKIYNSDTRLLNALGFCFYKAGKKKEALEALASSLRLNPEQPEVKKLIAEIKK